MDGSTESIKERQAAKEVIVLQDDETIPKTDQGHKTKSYGISIDSTLIRSVPVDEQASALRDLGINVFNQEEFEEGVLKQVDQAIAVQETEEVLKGWEKDLKAVDEDIKAVESDLQGIDKILKRHEGKSGSSYEGWRKALAVQRQKDNKLRQLKKLEAKQKSLHHKLGIGEEKELEVEDVAENSEAQNDNRDKELHLDKKDQSESDLLIRSGEMTPFGGTVENVKGRTESQDNSTDQRIERHLLEEREKSLTELQQGSGLRDKEAVARLSSHRKTSDDDDDYIPEDSEMKGSWYDDEQEASERKGVKSKERKRTLNINYTEEDRVQPKKGKKKTGRTGRKGDSRPVDDGNEKIYRQRIRELRIKELLKKRVESQTDINDEEDFPDMDFDKGLKIPGNVWHKLYKYQQTGVQWLWELHCQQAGGVVGDEMGLGKTIQMIVFLAGLKYSKISARKSRHGSLGPVLIVCPVTVLHQWVQEFHKWWPEFRVAVLHDTGTYQGFKRELIRKICKENGVLVTSYSGVRQHQDHLLAQRFDYVILDEGHKIRNPDAEITLACKQFRTPHRIILSGSPMQNNLRELWSLFDFVFPGKLGTLPVFMTEFSVPITQGGYSNATKMQVETAYKCACVLRDTINPYLLRRLKKDVKMSLELPSKNEQVLFCRLSDEQRELYEQYLDSKEVQAILGGNYKVFPGLIMLRKICNHPDLTSEAGSMVKAKQDSLKAELGGEGEAEEPDPDDGYGDWRRAGKMIVVEALLKMWHRQGHRVLLFSQTRQMLNILEKFVSSKDYTYFRMDGSTPVAKRQPLVKDFNEDSSIFLFLLTTRVGGLGVNLVGADRIIIYDPDWNPSTDTQARERAWRIGQTKPVTIYRLLTTGTIEEKIYHRQIFKQFLTNRVLKDPKQRRFFKSNDLYELFTLDSCDKRCGTETSAIFAGSNCEVKVPGSRKRKKAAQKEEPEKHKLGKIVAGTRPRKLNRKERGGDDGGGFCIDWRDVQETRSLSKKEDDGKENGKEAENVDEGNEGEEDDTQKLSCDQENDETSTVVTAELQSCSSNGGNPTTLIQQGGITNASEIHEKTNSVDRLKTATNTVSESSGLREGTSVSPQLSRLESSSIRSKAGARPVGGKPVSSAGLTSSKRGKNKISTLSDEELKKRVRLKEKKKKRRRAKLDGQRIDNLDYHEIFNPQNTSQSSAEEIEETKQQSAHQDEFILKQLFKKTGVHSALKHDVIMESSNPDLALVEGEANRVAQNAVKALKRSRQRCLGAVSGVPTWTGTSGSSGLLDPPPKRPRFGQKSFLKKSTTTTEEPPKKASSIVDPKPHFSGDLMGMSSVTEEALEPAHSSQLLAKMRARNNLLSSDETSTQVPGDERDSLLVEMRNFVALQCDVIGQATTQEILGEFGSRLPQSDSSVFRSMLRQICTFTRDSSTGQGIWKLNEEFR